jgi:class 3 adenylate cyclase
MRSSESLAKQTAVLAGVAARIAEGAGPRPFRSRIPRFVLNFRELEQGMSETRKLAAILVADVVGYGRLAGADEDRTLARLRTLRSDLIDPTIAVHQGRIVNEPATAPSSNSAAS